MPSRARTWWLLAATGALAGLLVGLIAMPVVGAVGYVANRGARAWESVACDLGPAPDLPQRTRIVAADGSTIADFYYQNRVAVPIDRIAPVMRQAIIAIEDARFYEHNGIDAKGTLRALLTDGSAGSVRQGGSTLTQQYVKNLLLLAARTRAEQRAAVADTAARKLREARCALQLEREMTKEQILAGYLNVAMFGPGVYGIEAASEHYFGRHASALTLPQAALLAGLVKNPTGYDPTRFPAAAVARRDVVLARMRDLGFLTEAQRAAAAAARLRLRVHRIGNGCEATRAPYFCEWVLDQVYADRAFGDTRAERVSALLRGGLTIRTTLDWTAQRAAEAAVRRYVPPARSRNPRRIASAEVLVEPGTGAVRAMAVSLPYGIGKGRNESNLAAGGSSGFQAGSTFKLFTLLTALEQQVPTSYTMTAPARYCSPVFPDYSCRGNHGVSNAGDSEAGRFTLVQATADSVNTYFVRLEEKVGVGNVAAMARRLGVDFTAFPGNREPGPADGSLTLGTWSVSPIEMAAAYAAVAARGLYCAPYAVSSARTGDGRALPVAGQRCAQAVSEGVADTAAQILTHVIDGPGGHTGARAAIGRPAAGKTGTTNGYGAAWFDGFTPQLAAAVWVGDPRGLVPGLNDVTLDGHFWPQVFGGDLPAMIWAATMRRALAGRPALPFAAADPTVVRGARLAVPDVAGLSPGAALAAMEAAGVQAEVAPREVRSARAAGTVAYTSPRAGALVGADTTVEICLSEGPPPVTPSPSPSPTLSGSPSASPSVSVSPSVSPSASSSVAPTTTPP